MSLTAPKSKYRNVWEYVPHGGRSSRLKEVEETYDKFIILDDLPRVISEFNKLCSLLEITPKQFPHFFNELRLKPAIQSYGKAERALSKIMEAAQKRGYLIDPKRTTNRSDIKIMDDANPDDEYVMNDLPAPCSKRKVLIAGGGPTGLRMAVECQFLGAQVIVLEQRHNFTRYNIAYIWENARNDLQELGISHFYKNFCTGAYNTISIRMLQFILLKLALILGVQFYYGVKFERLIEPSEGYGWRARVNPPHPTISNFEFDVIVDCTGKKNSVYPIDVIELPPQQRAQNMIALMANFVYNGKLDEMYEQIAGVSEHVPNKYTEFLKHNGMLVENIVYYRRETHYFIMTLKKQTLKPNNLIYEEFSTLRNTLTPNNINKMAVEKFAVDAANMVTNESGANSAEKHDRFYQFNTTERGEKDVSIFFYEARTQAGNSSRILEKNGKMLLAFLAGDGLIQPFWPSGSGIITGFLSVLDACWVMKLWSLNEKRMTPLQILATKEYLYSHLKGLSNKAGLIKTKKSGSILDPWCRYAKNFTLKTNHAQIRLLYETDIDFHGKEIEEIPLFEVYCSESSDKNYGLEVILDWYNELLSMLDITVVDFTTSWRNGIALLAVICLWEPTLVDWLSLSDDDKKNVQRAINILALKFGIPPTLTAEKIVVLESEEDAALMARYLNKILNVFTSNYKDLIVEIKNKLKIKHDGQPLAPGICLPEAETIKEQLGPEVVKNIMLRMQKPINEEIEAQRVTDAVADLPEETEENLVVKEQSKSSAIPSLSKDKKPEALESITETDSVGKNKVSMVNLEISLAQSQEAESELKLLDPSKNKEKTKDDNMMVEELPKVKGRIEMITDEDASHKIEGKKDADQGNLKELAKTETKWEVLLQKRSNLEKSGSLPNLKLLMSGGECCAACDKLMYSVVRLITPNGYYVHKTCLKCCGCKRDLSNSLYNFDSVTKKFYCEDHDVCPEDLTATSEGHESDYESDEESLYDGHKYREMEYLQSTTPVDQAEGANAPVATLGSDLQMKSLNWLQQNPEKFNVVLKDPVVQNALVMAALKNPELEGDLVKELGCNPMKSNWPTALMTAPVEHHEIEKNSDTELGQGEVDDKQPLSEKHEDVKDEKLSRETSPGAVVQRDVDETYRSLQRTYSWTYNKRTMPSKCCHFCGKHVLLTEGVMLKKKNKTISFHRQCLKCQKCHRMLTMSTYEYDDISGRFSCGAHDTTDNKDGQKMPGGEIRRGTRGLKAPSKWKLAQMALRLARLFRVKD